MMWFGPMGANRALAMACWLGTAIVSQSWRLPLAAISTATRRHGAGRGVGLAPVSRAWLESMQQSAQSTKMRGDPARVTAVNWELIRAADAVRSALGHQRDRSGIP
jgi:hypothetical protein